MVDEAVRFEAIPAQQVATLTRSAAGWGSERIGPVVGPMFPEVLAHLSAAHVANGPAIAVYEADEERVRITAGFVVDADVEAVPGVDVHVLPAVPRAAVLVHHGALDRIDSAWTALMDAVAASGSGRAGSGREVYLTPGDRSQAEWVTRLVQPVS